MKGIYPIQKVSNKERNKKDKLTDKDWWEQNADYFIEATGNDDYDLNILYNAVDGIIDDSDYDYVLNPFNTKIDKYKKFGAKLRDFNILEPAYNLFLGEYIKRFKHIQVIDTNPGDESIFKEQLAQLHDQYYAQQLANGLNSEGVDTGISSQEQPPLEEVNNTFREGFDSNRIISGQEALDYIAFDADLDEKFVQMYEHYLKVGRFFSYKGIHNDDVDFEVCDPREMRCPVNMTGITFVEDLPYVVRHQKVHVNTILDRFNTKLSDECLDFLAGLKDTSSKPLAKGYTHLPSQYISDTQQLKQANRGFMTDSDLIDLYHVVWRSWKKYQILTYENELGQILEMEVDEDYKLNKELGDIELSEEWETCICETWRIDEDFYVDKREIPYNRAGLNKKVKQKLPYNGRIFVDNDGEPVSLIKGGLVYQTLYNIFHYQFEKIMNKNKDKIAVIPQGLIPKGKNGFNEENFFYYTNANSMMFVDETSPTASLALQGIKVLDMSLANYAKEMIEIMTTIKNEWWEKIGMNRQRFGDVKASDGKGNTEQAIFRSSVISENLSRRFEKLEEKDYAGLLDLSKLAWINGKKGVYINSDKRKAFLDLNIDEAIYYAESEFDVHVRNSRVEQEKLDMIKEASYAIAQQGDNIEVWLETIDVTNFEKAKELIKREEFARKQLQQANLEADRENQKAIQDGLRESEEAERENRRYVADKQYDSVVDAAMIKKGDEGNVDIDKLLDNILKQRKVEHDMEVDAKKLAQADEELKIKEQVADAHSKNADTNRIKAKQNNSKTK